MKKIQYTYGAFKTICLIAWMMMVTPSSVALIQSKPQVDPFMEYEASYKISWHGIHAGNSTHRLHQRKDGLYHYETHTKPVFSFIPYGARESSDFKIENDTVIPQNYFYDIKEGKRKKRGNVFFDWKASLVSNKTGKSPWQQTLTPGLQDKLTHSLLLRKELSQGKSKLSYQVTEDDEIKTYNFTVLGRQMLSTKLGELHTIKVEHISRSQRRTTIWFAVDLDYVPVKMIQHRKGQKVGSAQIASFSRLNKRS